MTNGLSSWPSPTPDMGAEPTLSAELLTTHEASGSAPSTNPPAPVEDIPLDALSLPSRADLSARVIKAQDEKARRLDLQRQREERRKDLLKQRALAREERIGKRASRLAGPIVESQLPRVRKMMQKAADRGEESITIGMGRAFFFDTVKNLAWDKALEEIARRLRADGKFAEVLYGRTYWVEDRRTVETTDVYRYADELDFRGFLAIENHRFLHVGWGSSFESQISDDPRAPISVW